MASKLEQLRQMTVVVADTGDIDAIEQLKPQDATTNPSLVLKVADKPRYQSLIEQAVQQAQRETPDPEQQKDYAVDRIAVAIGAQISAIIPGYISTEVSARLSFDIRATVEKARRLIALYQEQGVGRERVLIKIAATWEGIKAAEILEQEGITCNLTLIFSQTQAVACAEAGATLISPFVGRILDWHKAAYPDQDFTEEKDPGVMSVQRIYNYYKQHAYNTIVMGASFRNTSEIEQLAGCDRLTISPALLEQLAADNAPLERKLQVNKPQAPRPEALNEAVFRWQMNQDTMATEKLSEGIRQFAADQAKLETLLAPLF
ncbi:transaldolase [Oceanospirillum linum]|uniref:Transaldolase n=1 Tax=Oceanospirillum linum TaxID=966 RepID=A0A1T1H8Y5_OCELI|nr:transaldolase [Oceanospirillum linum]OOV86298.1 transaldolase [Oceanospirillum linum]SEG47079.1 transaldolase [Oleiphilus messinensis]SMP30900.1 transaldolase [Oceanospirillum linum]